MRKRKVITTCGAILALTTLCGYYLVDFSWQDEFYWFNVRGILKDDDLLPATICDITTICSIDTIISKGGWSWMI